MPCVKETDEKVMERLLNLPVVFTYEDHNVDTGIGPRITAYLLKHGFKGKMESFGVKAYGVSATQKKPMLPRVSTRHLW